MNALLPLLFAYLIGAIPFGLLLSKLAGQDIRKAGSGNIGATNVLRVCGWQWGVPALLLDMLKGAAPVLLVRFDLWSVVDEQKILILALTALAAVLGHTFPIYLKFKGGKGVATSGGVLFALMPVATAIALALLVVTVATTRYVSVGSTVAAATIVTAHHLLSEAPYGADLPITLLAWLILLLIAILHRSNYGRLLNGTENKLGKKREASPEQS